MYITHPNKIVRVIQRVPSWQSITALIRSLIAQTSVKLDHPDLQMVLIFHLFKRLLRREKQFCTLRDPFDPYLLLMERHKVHHMEGIVQGK